MVENILVKLFEHNNWANLKIIEACAALDEGQLDAEPQSATKGSIRRTLFHLVGSQLGYLNLLTLPVESRAAADLTFAGLHPAAVTSGEGLLALAKDESSKPFSNQLETRDGYLVEPWVVMLQAINHATEHREQIKSMLTALGVAPPEIDGWDFGLAANALFPASK